MRPWGNQYQGEKIFACEGCGYATAIRLLTGQKNVPEIICPDCGKYKLCPSRLTAREMEVIQELTSGLKASAIAAKLFISNKTVESHRKMIYRKLLINDLANLTKYALQKGYTSPEIRYCNLENSSNAPLEQSSEREL